MRRGLSHVIIYTIKITSEFKNMSVTVSVVDGLALHGRSTGCTDWRCMENYCGLDCGLRLGAF